LQPIPKGLNLKDFLFQILDSLMTLNVLASEFANRQISVNDVLANGTYVGPTEADPPYILNPGGIMAATFYTGLIESGVSSQLKTQRDLLQALDDDYLKAGGSMYINSRYNRTN
jgi:hypothetical protein